MSSDADADLFSAVKSDGMFLWHAANSGNENSLKAILALPEAKKNVDYIPSHSKDSPLMAATRAGSLQCVKLLLYHGANIDYTRSGLFGSQSVMQVAKKEKFPVIEQYLKNCKEDLLKMKCTRALLELELRTIVSLPNCSESDGNLKNFAIILERLKDYCNFDVNRISDEDGKFIQPLLIRAAKANNTDIVLKLLKDYQADALAFDPTTKENLLHVCFQTHSQLRFELVLKRPLLLHQFDSNEDTPLFIAAKELDTAFFRWLFGKAEKKESVLQIPESPREKYELSEVFEKGSINISSNADISYSLSEDLPESPPMSDVVAMKPFRVNKSGSSILHILARQGSHEILSIFKNVCELYDGFDFGFYESFNFSCLSVYKGAMPLPIVEAFVARSLPCVKILLDLAVYSDQLKILLADENVMKHSVNSKNIEIIKALIQHGFHKGLNLALILASSFKNNEILSLLIFWYTQVEYFFEFVQQQKISRDSFDFSTCRLMWQELSLLYAHPSWFVEARNAMCITATLSSELLQIKESLAEVEATGIKMLGQKCLEYFESKDKELNLPPVLTEGIFVKITSINLCNNLLTHVPNEIFNLASLTSLNLSYNKIKSLPSLASSQIHSIKLQVLTLSVNEITSLPDDLIWATANSLEKLYVDNNQLESIPTGLWLIPTLKEVNLANNKLTKMHYLSSPRLFRDLNFIEKIALFDSSLHHPEKDEKEVCRLVVDMKRLAALHRTMYAIKFPNNPMVSDEAVFKDIVKLYQAKVNMMKNLTVNPSRLDLLLPFSDGAETFVSELTLIDISNNQFLEVPWSLPCLAPNLKKFHFKSNCIGLLDIAHDFPSSVRTLILSSNRIVDVCRERPNSYPCAHPANLLLLSRSCKIMGYCKHCQHESLDKLNSLNLDDNLLEFFPILKMYMKSKSVSMSDSELMGSKNLSEKLLFPDMANLSLERNKLTEVPKYLYLLQHLASLKLSHNPISELPEEMGLISKEYFMLLKLDGLKPKNVPENLLTQPGNLIEFLRDLKQKAIPYRQMKLMFIGEANMGKTTLLINLTKKGQVRRYSEIKMGRNKKPLSTTGVDIGDFVFSPSTSKPEITFMTWDFGGQEEYYATHQCFLSKRSLYLLLWNVQDGEDGLKSLQPWLENIGSCAPQSPVIVIGTHLDLFDQKSNSTQYLQDKFEELYIKPNEGSFAYPSIHRQCYFIDVHNVKDIDQLREVIYNTALEFTPKPKFCGKECKPLLEKKFPEYFKILQEKVRSIAEQCTMIESRIFTKKDLLMQIQSDCDISENDFDQAVSFLHDNGILLHYDDNSSLSDYYFVDPQWLCTNLANVIAVKNVNCDIINGFMWRDKMDKKIPHCKEEIINLMTKFEVIHLLDEKRVLIPSSLPSMEENACIIYSNALAENSDCLFLKVESDDFVKTCDLPIFSRYFLLPFVPNGCFGRLIARFMTSDIIEQLYASLATNPLESLHSSYKIHWRCWREGIVIVWNKLEILRITKISAPTAFGADVILISESKSEQLSKMPQGLEVRVAVIPEEKIIKCRFLEPTVMRLQSHEILQHAGTPSMSKFENKSKGKCTASWLLHRVTSIIDSVFNDWYEGFASKDERFQTRTMSDFCSQCVSSAANTDPDRDKKLAMYTSKFCCLTACKREKLECPNHGSLNVEDVAPDLVFCDFHPATVFSDNSSFQLDILHPLGEGGYGTVYKAELTKQPFDQQEPIKVAMKKINQEDHKLGTDEAKAWDIYLKASSEARLMNKLYHKNILSLVGFCSWPDLTMLVEFAPRGDLHSILHTFKNENVQLSRRTIRETLIQMAEGLDYLHCLNIIYRDLKPENILVWKYPQPKTQWSLDSSVHIKLADYGISSEASSQGMRGIEGTDNYQPPEILLHRGKKMFSTQVDVYAFGMCIYTMLALEHPFAGCIVGGELKDKKRPHLKSNLYPNSIQIVDLMCWCWSEQPHQRPSFQQILHVLKSEAFTTLLATAPLVDPITNITSVCGNTQLLPFLPSTPSDSSPSFKRIMTLLHNKQPQTSENAVQIWCGTTNGRCELIQFQPSVTTKKELNLPIKVHISKVEVIDVTIWIATIGSGIYVYDTKSFDCHASWGVNQKQVVFNMLYIDDMSLMLALTDDGIYEFSTVVKNGFDYLEPKNVLKEKLSPLSINVGVCIPFELNMNASEVWVCSQSIYEFFILNPSTLKIIQANIGYASESSDQMAINHSISHLETMTVLGRMKLAVADNWVIHLWDVETRNVEKTFNCHEEEGLKKYELAGMSGKITSLVSDNEVLYLGLEAGLIVCISSGMTLLSIYHAYDKAVRKLILLRPTLWSNANKELFSQSSESSRARAFSTIRSNRAMESIPAMDGRKMRRNASTYTAKPKVPDKPAKLKRLPKSTTTSKIRSPEHANAESGRERRSTVRYLAENSVLLSLGGAYRGVIGTCENYPTDFMLPTSKATTTEAKAGSMTSHLLLWTTEKNKLGPSLEQAIFDMSTKTSED